MQKRGDSLFKRTKKTISVLVFETTKHSRIMKKRMRIGALQKGLKADYRDLGRMVYDALVSGKEDSVFKDPEISKLVENITSHNHEMERLREGIARISRARKAFDEPQKALPPPASDASEPAKAPKAKRGFLGMKKKKASEELAKMVAEDLAKSVKIPETAKGEEIAPPAKAEKPKKGFLGFRKKKKADVDPKDAAEKPAKQKRSLFGMKKKPAKA